MPLQRTRHVTRANSESTRSPAHDRDDPRPDIVATEGPGTGHVQALMAAGGNQAMVQLTEGDGPYTPDPGLEAALAELDRALARRPDPGSFEAITAATGTKARTQTKPQHRPKRAGTTKSLATQTRRALRPTPRAKRPPAQPRVWIRCQPQRGRPTRRAVRR